jgi:hypothetical protein
MRRKAIRWRLAELSKGARHHLQGLLKPSSPKKIQRDPEANLSSPSSWRRIDAADCSMIDNISKALPRIYRSVLFLWRQRCIRWLRHSFQPEQPPDDRLDVPERGLKLMREFYARTISSISL